MTEEVNEPGQPTEHEPGIPRHKVLVAGSRWIKGNYNQISRLAKLIGAKIMDEENWILLNNGASEISSPAERVVSIPRLVCDAALEELRKSDNLNVEEESRKRILTLHPEKYDGKLHKIGKVEIAGENAHLRRVELAEQADAIITIEGSFGTKDIIEQTIRSKKPLLPIACTGGESAKGWKDSEEYILHTFGIKKQSEEYEMLTTTKGLEDPSVLSDLVIKIIKDNLEPVESAVPSHTDNPTEEDLLDRKTFAKVLAMQLNDILDEGRKKVGEVKVRSDNTRHAGAFLLHIDGTWGSGKTSLLNLLRKELEEQPNPWVVVYYNAWQYQSVAPPWWSLMLSVYNQNAQTLWGVRKKRWRTIKLKIVEHFWRLLVGRSRLLFGIALLSFVIGVSLLFGPSLLGTKMPAQKPSTEFLDLVKNQVPGIIAIIVSLVSGITAITKSLLPGSERAAREFEELTSDPTKHLRSHFESLIKMVNDPVIIFIDDLDRCNADYTVRLLEGIQTMFRQADVFYVVAADRRWLYSSYEKVYSSFTSGVKEAGRPLGYLFLQKTFQLSVSLPHLEPARKRSYLRRLTGSKQDENRDDKTIRAKVAKDLEMIPPAEIENRLNDATGDQYYDQIFRQEAALKLEHPRSKEYTEHLLQPFADLLEANPRAMKRFVNAYRIARALKVLGSAHVDKKKLALWTILTMRWPTLADYLQDNPQLIEQIRTKKRFVYNTDLDEDLQSLLCDADVYDVVTGKDIGTFLDEETVRTMAGLQMLGTKRGLVM
jgi:Cdc6-like AAA superfamily ATPase